MFDFQVCKIYSVEEKFSQEYIPKPCVNFKNNQDSSCLLENVFAL